MDIVSDMATMSLDGGGESPQPPQLLQPSPAAGEGSSSTTSSANVVPFDVNVVLEGGYEVGAYKADLCKHSEIFQSHLQGQQAEGGECGVMTLRVPVMNVEVFSRINKFFSTRKLPPEITLDENLKLIDISQIFKMEILREHLIDRVIELLANMVVQDVFKVLTFARRERVPELYESTFEFICSYPKEFIRTHYFYMLGVTQVWDILESENLRTKDEYQVFCSALEWARWKHRCSFAEYETTAYFFMMVIRCIRFQFMSPMQISNLIRSHKHELKGPAVDLIKDILIAMLMKRGLQEILESSGIKTGRRRNIQVAQKILPQTISHGDDSDSEDDEDVDKVRTFILPGNGSSGCWKVPSTLKMSDNEDGNVSEFEMYGEKEDTASEVEMQGEKENIASEVEIHDEEDIASEVEIHDEKEDTGSEVEIYDEKEDTGSEVEIYDEKEDTASEVEIYDEKEDTAGSENSVPVTLSDSGSSAFGLGHDFIGSPANSLSQKNIIDLDTSGKISGKIHCVLETPKSQEVFPHYLNLVTQALPQKPLEVAIVGVNLEGFKLDYSQKIVDVTEHCDITVNGTLKFIADSYQRELSLLAFVKDLNVMDYLIYKPEHLIEDIPQTASSIWGLEQNILLRFNGVTFLKVNHTDTSIVLSYLRQSTEILSGCGSNVKTIGISNCEFDLNSIESNDVTSLYLYRVWGTYELAQIFEKFPHLEVLCVWIFKPEIYFYGPPECFRTLKLQFSDKNFPFKWLKELVLTRVEIDFGFRKSTNIEILKIECCAVRKGRKLKICDAFPKLFPKLKKILLIGLQRDELEFEFDATSCHSVFRAVGIPSLVSLRAVHLKWDYDILDCDCNKDLSRLLDDHKVCESSNFLMKREDKSKDWKITCFQKKQTNYAADIDNRDQDEYTWHHLDMFFSNFEAFQNYFIAGENFPNPRPTYWI